MIGGSNFYTDEELSVAGFKSIGSNVKISRLASIYKQENMVLGDNIRIEDYCILNGKITIGSDVTICAFCLLDGYAGITIENDVTLAAKVSIHSGSDDYSGKSLFGTYVPSKFRKYHISSPVVIKSHTLIGDSSIIMPGIVIGEGTAIGANSFLRDCTEPWGIYAGNPARRIKDRSTDLLHQYDLLKQNKLDELTTLINGH